MDKPKCRLCGERHYGACAPSKSFAQKVALCRKTGLTPSKLAARKYWDKKAAQPKKRKPRHIKDTGVTNRVPETPAVGAVLETEQDRDVGPPSFAPATPSGGALTQAQRDKRWRASHREQYNAYMRAYRKRRK